MNLLEQLQKYSILVADSASLAEIKQNIPVDATTNPQLILQMAQSSENHNLIRQAKNTNNNLDLYQNLSVLLAKSISEIIPGRISIEADITLSFDQEATYKYATVLIDQLSKIGVDKNRVLIKIAATYEGVQAAKKLEAVGIYCNLTLIFNLYQAILCADAGVTLISPFVGRITDWYKQKQGVPSFEIKEDPGILSVQQIYNYFKKFNYATQVMAASFRSTEQVLALAGCDLLTVAPKLITEIKKQEGNLNKALDAEKAKKIDVTKISLSEQKFLWQMTIDEMANFKLAEGIRGFHHAMQKLLLEI